MLTASNSRETLSAKGAKVDCVLTATFAYNFLTRAAMPQRHGGWIAKLLIRAEEIAHNGKGHRIMDQASKQVAQFLEALQTSRERLHPRHFELIGRPAKSFRPLFGLSGRPFRVHDSETVREFSGSVILGLSGLQRNGKEMEFTIYVLWDNDQWTIQTIVWEDCDTGQDVIRSFPDRHSQTLEECLVQLESAINDLTGCIDLFDSNV